MHWRRDRLPIPLFSGFPGGPDGKEFACNVRDLGLIPGLGRWPREGNSYPLQYPGLENSMDCIVPAVTKNLYFTIGLNFTCLQGQGRVCVCVCVCVVVCVCVSLEAVSSEMCQ